MVMRHPAARQINDASTPSRDPTGTLDIRNRYKTLLDQRWRKFLTQVRAVITVQDMMGLENKVQQTPLGMAMNVLPPDGRLRAFQAWVDTSLTRNVIENEAVFLDPMIQGTYNRAIKRAMRLTKSTAIPKDAKNVVAHLQQLSLVELQGITEAVSQRVVRVAAQAVLDKVTPAELNKQIMLAVQQVGMVRTRALVEVMVAKTHSTASLDQFAAAGVKRVGLIPETMPAQKLRDARGVTEPAPARRGTSASTIGRIAREEAKVARKFKATEVEVLTAGDDLVCPECEEISADGPYTIDEARSLIPAHPNCRCAFVPEGSALFANLLGFTDEAEWNEEDHPRDPGGEGGGQFTSGGGLGGEKEEDKPKLTMKEEHSNFRTVTKGTNDAQNERIVKDNGVKIELGGGVSQRDANEAVAHIITDSKNDAALLSTSTVKFSDMGPRLRGNQSGKVLSIDSKAMKEGGPGYASGIIRHELEHRRLTDAKVPSGKQEGKVQHTAGAWAARMSGNMHKTNPVASKGFHRAAAEQGINVGKW